MKNFKLFLFILFLFSSPLYAADRVDLSEHGKELIRASFPMRHAFTKKHNKDWIKSTYNERKEFLTDWHLKEIQDSKEEANKAKQEAREAKEKAREKRAKEKAKQQKLKAKSQKEKAEAKENKIRNKNFDKKVKEGQKTLDRLRR